MTYLIVIAALIFLVVIHELGHFSVAKLFKIRATKFYIFFPPSLFKVQHKGTEYGIGAIPLGGYVKLPGMYHPEAPLATWDASIERLKLAAPLKARTSFPPTTKVKAAWLSSDKNVRNKGFLAAVDVVSVEIESWYRKTVQDLTINESKELNAAWLSFSETWSADLYWRAKVRHRLATIFAGPLANFLAAFILLTISIAFLTPIVEGKWQLEKIVKDSPAQKSGLKAGDQIVEYEGIKVRDNRWLTKLASQNKNDKTLNITIKRAGELKQFNVTRDKNDHAGIEIGAHNLKQVGWDHSTSVPTAMGQSVKFMGYVAWSNIKGLATILQKDNRKQVGTIVSVVGQSNQIAKQGELLGYIALISLILAVFNLLPLLPLDGGHIVICLLEKVRRGRPVPMQLVNNFAVFGLVLLLGLFLLGLSNDITR